MTNSNNLQFALLQQSQAQKEITVNEALTTIDALMNRGANSMTVSTPPGSPNPGDLYIVGPSPTGAWAGQVNNIAWYNQLWQFIVPNEGLSIWVSDQNKTYTFNGTSWFVTDNALAILGDVSLSSSIANGSFLSYNSSSSKWNDVTGSGLISSLGLGTMSTQNASAVAVTGCSITGMATPVNASDVANKSYVDNATAGLSQRDACRVISTSNLSATYSNGTSGIGATLTNSGTQAAIVIDGVTLNSGNRVLVQGQSTTANNGIYTVTTIGSSSTNWVLTRGLDYNSSTNILEGTFTVISEGTSFKGTLWLETGTGPFTVGTTNINFTELSVASQTDTFTGDVTGTGAGSIALTIGNSKVTYAKMQNESATTLLGNPTGSAAAPSEITLGSTLAFSSGALQTAAQTGDVTTSANSFATTIAANAVTYAKFQQVAATSLVGNSTGSTANAAAVAFSTFAQTANNLSDLGSASTARTNLGLGSLAILSTVGTSNISSSAVTYAKIQNESATTLLGNPTGSAAAPSKITLGSTLAFSSGALQTTAHTGDVTSSANSNAMTIAANAVTYAKFQQVAATSLVGNSTGSTTNAAAVAFSTFAQTANNLSDLASASTARTNLGLGSLATLSTVGTSNISSSAVTYAKIQNESATTLFGNPTGSAAAPSEITLGSGLSFSSSVLNTVNNGTVTSVGITMPAEFSVSGSPVTTSGTLAVTKANQNANLFYAGPASGSAAAPTFRSLTVADLPVSDIVSYTMFGGF